MSARARAAAIRSTAPTQRPQHALSRIEAARIALAAQGFGEPARASVRLQHLERMSRTLGAIQIDSVNVLTRSHYLPFYSRLGPYPAALLERLAYGRPRRVFEYWGHEASLLPVALFPLLRWRMERARRGEGIYAALARFARERADYVAAVLTEVTQKGPLSARELSAGGRGKGAWWGWSDGKRALEYLFWAGLVTTATRRSFERVYDLTERALPLEVLSAPVPAEHDAHRALLALAADALGVATERDLRDYFRLPPEGMRLRIDELVAAGTLMPVAVDGWKELAYLHADYLHTGAAARRPVRAAALLSPFDSLVWFRPRAERLFDFRYRLELYTPSHQRVYGYYVLPLLLGERIAARVDLKADRQGRALLVPAVHREPHAGPELAQALAVELRRMAGWLDLESVRLGSAARRVTGLAAALRA
jgi:uncharacterized protein YcaQ